MAALDGGRILVVDDEPNALKVLSAILKCEGYIVSQAQSVDKAIKIINHEELDAVITDMKMPGGDGMQLYEYLAENSPEIPVIFLTAYGTVDSAVTAMTRGAYYYFIKPPDYGSLKRILGKAVEQRRLKREIEQIRKKVENSEQSQWIIGKNPQWGKILSLIESIKNTESSVLVCGETGTGKELIARALHYNGSRKNRPFVTVNCAAIPRELIESELFGYEKGAFTGATSRRVGRVEQAAGGTLFLDEIGELELPVQAKFLRVLQEKEIQRLGSNENIPVNFRLISSTNRFLEKEVGSGNFREDLFYRIDVVKINVPALRDRRDDIPLLVSEFIRQICSRENKVVTVSSSVMAIFQNYSWPGNVRQLRNIVERAVVLSNSNTITEKELPEELLTDKKPRLGDRPTRTLKEMETQAIREALEKCGGNKSKAANLLGFSRKALYKRLRDFNFM
jgi:DNA-binding NtrC family response regulator